MAKKQEELIELKKEYEAFNNKLQEDFAERLVNAKTHDYILFFSNKGKVYRIKGYEIPEFFSHRHIYF